MKKRQTKKKQTKDYSMIINALIITIIAVIAAFAYISGGKKEEVKPQTDNNRQTNVQVKKEQPQQIKQENQQILPPFENYKFKYTYIIDIKGYVKNFILDLPIPQNEEDRQYISDYKMSIEPSKIYKDDINTIAQFSMPNLYNQQIILTTEGIAKVRTYNIKLAQAMNNNKLPEKDLSKYLKSEPYIESNDPYIIGIANKIKGNTQEEIIQNIYEYAQKNMTYKVMQNIGAKKALQIKQGKCSEFSNVMTALCRAKKIPARIVMGNIAREKYTQHNWVEVYFDKYGWVAFDPTTQATVVNIRDANGKLVRQEKRYDTSHDKLRYITSGRNKYSTYNISYSVSDRKGGHARVTEKVEISKI